MGIPRTREQRRQSNENIAVATKARLDGTFDDPILECLLNDLEDYVKLEAVGGDYFYLSRPARKDGRALKDPDKVFLVAEPRVHGMEQDPLTHKAIHATQQLHENGGVPLVAPRATKEALIPEIKRLLDKCVMDSSIAAIGSGGARGNRNAEQLRDVTASLLVDTYNGYNSRAGYAFGGMPLDAGHIIGHASRPDLSDKGSNLEYENQYANKGKSATEKMAANLGREATDAELAQGLFKSHINKLVADVVLPGRKNSKERQAYMSHINSKIGTTQAGVAL